MHLTVTTTFCTHCHFVKQTRALRVPEVCVHTFVPTHSAADSASLFGACVSLLCSLMEGQQYVQLPPGTTECNHSYYAGNSFLSITLCSTVTEIVRSPILCSHFLTHRRQMALLLQVSCPAHHYHAVQFAHKFLCVPLVMTQVMQCRLLRRSRNSHSSAASRLLLPSRLRPPVPISLLDAVVQPTPPCDAFQDVSTQTSDQPVSSLSLDVAVQTSFHCVHTSSLDAAVQTLPHSTLSQDAFYAVGLSPSFLVFS